MPPALSDRPAESLLDRADAFTLMFAFAAAVYHYSASLPFVAQFDVTDESLIHRYPVSMPLIAVVLYLLMVHGLGPILRRQAPKDSSAKVPLPFGIPESLMRFGLRYWNLFLTVLSIIMFYAFVVNDVVFMFRNGFQASLCDNSVSRWTGPSVFWVTIFTLSKFAELFDTAFLVLRRRSVSFLHWYHHTSVLLYCWFAIYSRFSPGFYFALINSFVHSVMYWYYFRSTFSVRLTYDKWITRIQITQMVLGLGLILSWGFFFYRSELASSVSTGQCPNKFGMENITSSAIMYGSYFFLFAQFYFSRYAAKNAKKSVAPKDD